MTSHHGQRHTYNQSWAATASHLRIHPSHHSAMRLVMHTLMYRAHFQELVRRVPAFMYCLVADENVYALYGEMFVSKFKATGKTLFVKVVPSGETTKHRQVKESIEDFMLENKFNRDSCCIALGGGVVGDLTGFVAATFMRGVPFVQVRNRLNDIHMDVQLDRCMKR
jgi:3-dehydroquinate synthetase